MTIAIHPGRRHGRMSNDGSFGARDGWIVPVVDKEELILGSAGTTEINFAQNVPSASWVSGVLITRVFTTPTFTGGRLTIYVVNSFVGDDDPPTLFGPASPTGTYVAKSTDFTVSTPAGTVDTVLLSSQPIGPQLRVFAECTPTGVAGSVTIGITLVGRRA